MHLAGDVSGSLTMLAQVPPVETASRYFTRRAQQERAKAAKAASAESRKAHLELALRMVTIAIEPALCVWTEGSPGGVSEIRNALACAYALPLPDSFESMLEPVSAT
jgi:hypothetical protein